jgi:ferredoxin-type protein NapH
MNRLRWLIQALVAFGTNSYLLFFFGGSVIYQGPLKAVCNPGLNCYSCPGALLSCPVGAFQNFMATLYIWFTAEGAMVVKAFQNFMGSLHLWFSPGGLPDQGVIVVGAFQNFMDSLWHWFSTRGLPNLGVIVVGYLGFIGSVVGRLTCGWICPFGFIQDLLYKIRIPKFPLWHKLRIGKYVVLVVMVVLMPIVFVDASGLGHPWFCKLVCPSGTLLGALPLLALKRTLWGTVGFYFLNKLTLLILILVAAILISRFFCRVICPLGAFYSLFSKISLVQLEFIEGNCVECGACVRTCPTGVIPNQEFDSRECIMCLRCVDACHFRALDFGIRRPPGKLAKVKRVTSPL